MTNISINKTSTYGLNVRGLAGTLSQSTVTDVQISGDVEGDTFVGGLAGQVINQNNISRSSFTGTRFRRLLWVGQ